MLKSDEARILVNVLLGRQPSAKASSDLSLKTTEDALVGIVLADEFIKKVLGPLKERTPLPHEAQSLKITDDIANWIRISSPVSNGFSSDTGSLTSWRALLTNLIRDDEFIALLQERGASHRNFTQFMAAREEYVSTLAAKERGPRGASESLPGGREPSPPQPDDAMSILLVKRDGSAKDPTHRPPGESNGLAAILGGFAAPPVDAPDGISGEARTADLLPPATAGGRREHVIPEQPESIVGEQRKMDRVQRGEPTTYYPLQVNGNASAGEIQLLITPQFTLVGAVEGCSDSDRKNVTLLVDGSIASRTAVDKPVPAELKKPGQVQSGFFFQLPEPPADSFTRTLQLKCGAATCQVVVDYRARFRGLFERYEFAEDKLRVAGWVHDRMREFTPVKIDIFYDGVLTSSVLANKSRPDLKQARVGMGNHSFDTVLPSPVRGGFGVEKLEIRIAETIIPLDRSKLSMFAPSACILLPAEGEIRPSEASAPEAFEIRAGAVSRAHGHIDMITSSEVRGWAYDPDDPEEPVVLDLLIDNQLVATARTDRFRADLAKKFGTSGYHAFSFEVLPQFGLTAWRKICVAVRRGDILSGGAKAIQMLPEHVALGPDRGLANSGHVPAVKVAQDVIFSLIVLNLNGAKVLVQFFETLHTHEQNRQFEIIIVDHGSSDNSYEVCQKYEFLNVRFIDRKRNFSFSESNNYAALQAKGSILVFLNNDIFWCQPVLDSVERALGDEAVGCVGIQLLDSPADDCELIPPTVQTLGIHFNFSLKDRAIHPVETRFDSSVLRSYFGDADVPCVTGAFLAMRRGDFKAVDGFDEDYNYGYEDVDLCLKVILDLKKRVVCANGSRAFHYRGYSRKKSGKWAGSNMRRNRARLETNFAYRVRRDLLSDVLERGKFWMGRPIVVAFAVTEASNNTAAGDFFTAAELGDAIQRLWGAKVIFLEEKKNWYDVLNVDVLIVMRHEYDLDKLTNKKASLITIGWARNWFDKWAEGDCTKDYSLLVASGSEAVNYLREKLDKPVFKLNIATNPHRFFPRDNAGKLYDVVFTGNFWGHPRDISYMFHPDAFSGNFRVFGAGWEQVENWKGYTQGLRSYAEMPSVYNSSKIVLDDANAVTKAWGSVNSRVYDALAAGCLVLTNGEKGSEDEFGGRLPVYRSSHELHDLLNTYLGNADVLRRKTAELRREILSHHTYDVRARQLMDVIRDEVGAQRRFAIKIGAPNQSVAHEWGDFHFALSLKNSLARLGHTVRIDCLDKWDSDDAYSDDCVVVLRGLSAYKTKPYHFNILWIISHPDMVSGAECETYDVVATASEKHREHLDLLGIPARTLLQCTDSSRFNIAERDLKNRPAKPLFVGNTRNIYRSGVKFAVRAGIDLNVVGAGWRDFIPASYVLADYIDNAEVGDYYRAAEFVVNDHWASMRSWGFISNRAFDVVACGTPLLSDRVEGMDELFGEAVVTFDDFGSFSAAAQKAADVRARRGVLRDAAENVLREHTFDRRAQVIVGWFKEWESRKARAAA